MTLEDDLIQLGGLLRAFPSGTASDSIPRQQRIKMCLAKLEEIGAHDPILIIFDNAEEATAIQPYTPNADYVHVLATSRDRGSWPAHSQVVIPPFHPEESVALYRRIVTKRERERRRD